jgi:hypothetical protein
MKTIKTLRPASKLALLALAGVALTPQARADSILLAQTTLVAGANSTVDSFSAPTAGMVTVNLQTLNWPVPLSALSFSATTVNSVLSSWNGTGMSSDLMTFNVAPGTYYAHVMATADTNSALDLGLYSLMVTFTPTVPLPAAGWMLLTGLFVLAGVARAARPIELTGTAAA